MARSGSSDALPARPRIAVTVPTWKRPQGLARLLDHLLPQVAGDSFNAEVRVVVVDNSSGAEAMPVVQEARARWGLPIDYVEEPQLGVPFARNACIEAAGECDAVVFIDDDEWPAPNWLENLVGTWQRTGADIVLGPVRGVLCEGAPRWARSSGVFNKDRRVASGAPIRTAYSYNTLVDRRVLDKLGPTFDPSFRLTGSSDRHYFKRAAALGFRTVWCAEALVFEEVGPDRLQLRWLVKRGYRTGAGAATTSRMLYPLPEAFLRIGVLAAANVGYAFVRIVGTIRSPFSWVEGIRRLSIAGGLLGGSVGLKYHEYEAKERRG